MTLAATPGQTVGPFFHYALPYDGGPDLVSRAHPTAIRLHGRVFDGDGVPVPDALLEIWQADEHGTVPTEPGTLHRDGWTFSGWGRAATDAEGRYTFTTVEPGATAPGAARFIVLTVFARGLLDRLLTRIYLPETDTTADPLLATLPADRRATLVAGRDDAGLLFDVVLQGAGETVFLEHRPTAPDIPRQSTPGGR